MFPWTGPAGRWEKAERGLNALATWTGLAACLYATGALAWVVAHRWRYRYELEWSEGIMAQVVERVMKGQPIYHAPSVDWVALSYTPLYYLASATLAAVRGLDLPTLRLVSIMGTALALLGIVSIVVRMTGNWRSAIASTGMLGAAFAPAGFWFDLARVDSLMLGLLCLGAAILYRARSARRWALGALVLVLAFWCKQPAVFFLAAFAVLAARSGRRAAVTFGTVAALGVLAPLALLHVASDGWSTFCLFTMANAAVNPMNARLFLVDDLLLTWWPLLVVATGWVFLSRDDKWYAAALLAAGFVAAFGARMRPGGFDNVLLPVQASLVTLAVAAAFAWARRPGPYAALAWILIATQVAWTAYSPAAQVPSQRDREFWDAFLTRIGALPGEVLVPTTAFIQRGAGKASNATWLPIMELEQVSNPHVPEFKRTLRERLSSGRVGGVVLAEERDTPPGPGLAFGMEALLADWQTANLALGPGAGYPVTGWQIRPRWLLLPPGTVSPALRAGTPPR